MKNIFVQIFFQTLLVFFTCSSASAIDPQLDLKFRRITAYRYGGVGTSRFLEIQGNGTVQDLTNDVEHKSVTIRLSLSSDAMQAGSFDLTDLEACASVAEHLDTLVSLKAERPDLYMIVKAYGVVTRDGRVATVGLTALSSCHFSKLIS